VGHLFLPVFRRPVPARAEIIIENGVRFARWRDAKGKLYSGEVRTTKHGDTIAVHGSKYIARFRDGVGVTRTVATGCRDESAARAMLVELERKAELVRSGVLTPAQADTANHGRSNIGPHLDAYILSLRAKGDTERHCKNVRRLVTTVFTACKFHALRDVKRETVEGWLARGEKSGRSARTRNTYLAACKWFLNYCVDVEKITANPLARIQLADEKADRRRQPRALSEPEIVRLLDAARRRPLEEARLCNRGWRKNQPNARLRPETVAKLERLGLERATAYKTMVLTGLRLGELSKLRVCDVVLDTERPHIVLDARHEKNREGSTIPLRADLSEDLRRWIVDRSSIALLFKLSSNLVKTLDRDLRYARIAKRDERGRTACVHSLRHSFATMMSRAGVAPRVAQAAMRHASVEMTLQTYTDARLLDISGALTALPRFELAPSGRRSAPAEASTQ
jgi:integrase